MAWTSPMTFVSNTALTAAQLNTYLRDNMNETAPAKATTSGYHFVSAGESVIAERPWIGENIPAYETTTSGSYTNLATTGPTITAVTGSQIMYVMSSQLRCTTAANTAIRVSLDISGATTIAASDNKDLVIDGLGTGNKLKCSVVYMETVTPGTNTFTMKYRTNAGATGEFGERHLILICL